MKKYQILLLSFLFLLSLFSINVFAYTEFSYNSFLDANISGIGIYNDHNVSYGYKAGNVSGCLFGCLAINSTGTVDYIEVYPLSTNNSGRYDDLGDFIISDLYNDSFMVLPATKEGLIFLRYRVNGTGLTSTYSKLYYYNGINLSSVSLNTTANITHNLSVIIPPVDYERNIVAYGAFETTIDPANILIDKFHVFTVDESDNRQTDWNSADLDIETLRYCSMVESGMSSVIGTTNSYWYKPTAGHELMWAYKLDNIFTCMMIYMNGTVVSRRSVNYKETDVGNLILNAYADPYLNFMIADFGNSNGASIIEKMTLNEVKISTVNAPSYICDLSHSYGLTSTGYPQTHPCVSFYGTPLSMFNYSGLLADNPNAVRQTINIIPYLNTSTPSGTTFRLRTYNYASGSWYYAQTNSTPLFTGQGALCEAEQVCNPYTNNVTLQTIDCQLYTLAYCGSWGCNADLTNCNYGFIGSYCVNNYTKKVISDNGTINYINCNYPTENCHNTTSTTADCYTDEEYEKYKKGNQTISQQLNITKISEATGEFIGIGEVAGRFLFGLAIILCVIIIMNYYYSKNTNKQIDIELNLLIFMFLLGFFTFGIPLIDPFIFVALIIIGVILLASKISKQLPTGSGG